MAWFLSAMIDAIYFRRRPSMEAFSKCLELELKPIIFGTTFDFDYRLGVFPFTALFLAFGILILLPYTRDLNKGTLLDYARSCRNLVLGYLCLPLAVLLCNMLWKFVQGIELVKIWDPFFSAFGLDVGLFRMAKPTAIATIPGTLATLIVMLVMFGVLVYWPARDSKEH